MKIYIIGPMEGEKDYLENFRAAEEVLLKLGHDVVNPAKLDKAVKGIGLSREDYLELDLKLLEWCDAIVMLDGWQQSRGCNREYGYVIGTKKQIITYNTLKTMEKGQKNEEQKNEWIRAKEQLPKNNEIVLVQITGQAANVGFNNALQIGYYDKDTHFWCIDGYEDFVGEVIAWQLLPDEYEGER